MEIHRLSGIKLTQQGTIIVAIAGAAVLYYLWQNSKK